MRRPLLLGIACAQRHTHVEICRDLEICMCNEYRYYTIAVCAPYHTTIYLHIHSCARDIIGCAAVNSAATRRAASESDRARALRCVRRRVEAAHTESNDVTDAVFHAPMFALKVDAAANA